MRRSFLVAACLIGVAGLAASVPANAASLPKLDGISATSAVQTVQGYGQCRYWRNQCAAKFGWGSRRFQYCLNNHGC